MSAYSYTMRPKDSPILGLVALQADQTIERDMRQLLPADAELYVSRVPQRCAGDLKDTGPNGRASECRCRLLPPQVGYDVVGYGCTSGTATIGADRIAAQVRSGVAAAQVTEPVSALAAACAELSITRLAILSPYVAEVSATLRGVLDAAGIETPVFGSFEEAEEARVVRIDEASIIAAARDLMDGQTVDGLFLSCTNLRTLGVIDPLEHALDLPVLSSNLVLGWHMAELSGLSLSNRAPGTLARTKTFKNL